MKKQTQHKLFGQELATLGLVLSISALPISAQAVNWNCANNFWDISSCWDTSVVPTNIDDVYVYTVGSADTFLKIDSYTGTASANRLRINGTTGTTVTLQQGGGALSTSYEFIGSTGMGAFTQSSGSNTITNYLTLGNSSTGNGSYNLSGTGTLSTFDQYIGNFGTGVFTQSGGSNAAANALFVGNNASGNGSYDLSGTGALSTSYQYIGNSGKGVFTQSGGNNAVTNTLVVGNNATGIGRYDLSGGALSANDETIGNFSKGYFNQSGGNNTVTNVLYLGNNASGNGSYDLSGTGTLLATEQYIGNSGTGVFTQSGGSNTAVSHLIVGRKSTGNGTYDLSGTGALSANYVLMGHGGTGVFTQSGGSSMTTNLLIVGNAIGGNGSYNLSGAGTISAFKEYIGSYGTGVFTQTGGRNTVKDNLYIGEGSGSNGTYTLSGGDLDAGNIYLGGNSITAGGTGVLNVNTGASVDITNQAKLWAGGTVNLTGGTINTGSLQVLSYGSFNFNAGTLNIATDLLIDPAGPLAGNLSLTGFKTLGVGGTTTLNGFSTLSLDGGTFSTGSLINNGGFAFNSGTFNLTNDNLVIGAGGLFGPLAQFNYGQTVNVTNVTTVNPGSILAINNSSFNSGITNNNGQINLNGLVASLGGGTINNAGMLTGSGQVSASLSNMAGGEVRVNTGDSLRFTGNGNINNNRISMLGGSVDFNQGLNNNSTGLITGYGTLVTGSNVSTGLNNQGNLAFSGTTDVIGDVNNTGAGAIIVSGGATTTFYDDVVHNGAEIRVGQGSQAVFFGAVSGAGAYTGSGTVFFEGDLAPGNSPSLVTVAGDMTLGSLSTTTMELGGLLRGTEYDAFDIGGTLSVGGELDVVLFDLGSGLFAPSLGDSFDLFAADAITGNFDLLTLAALGGNLDWKLDYLVDEIGTIDIARLSIVSSVPVPPSVWLFGSGLLGLIGIARRGKI